MPKKTMVVGHNGFLPTHIIIPNVANGAGGGAGQDVTVSLATSFTDQWNQPFLPNDYCVLVTASQDAIASVTGKTTSGFSVTLTPKTASATIASGQFDVVVLANT